MLVIIVVAVVVVSVEGVGFVCASRMRVVDVGIALLM